jgi:hypothetical protein
MNQIPYENRHGVFEGDYDYFAGKNRHNFTKVAHPVNWKLHTVTAYFKTPEEAEDVRNAVIYFTGSVPREIEPINGKYGVGRADGYYVDIGA